MPRELKVDSAHTATDDRLAIPAPLSIGGLPNRLMMAFEVAESVLGAVNSPGAARRPCRLRALTAPPRNSGLPVA
jgi:hypothetical protein